MKWLVALVALILLGALVLLPQAGQQSRPLSAIIPAGPLVYLEARDFAALVRDWNSSAEKKTWLASANYQVFSNSRLFLRLKEAQDQFGAAAGFAPDMTLVDAVAGGNSALALYDLGNLEFLYVTRMPQAKAYQSMLWQSRAKFQPRKSANIDYFVRQQQSRTAAFAVTADLLLLATSEPALAGALALIGNQTAPAMTQESWYQRAATAGSNAGELRMAINFQRTLATPYYRSYWIHRNASEMSQFDSVIADLDRPAAEYRERRVLIRPQASADLRGNEPAVAELSRAAPADAGLVRAWAKPETEAVVAMLEQKLFAPRGAATVRDAPAPSAGNMDATVGSEDDLETRIDEAPLSEGSAQIDLAPIRAAISANAVQAMMQVETSRPSPDPVFVNLPRAIALLGERNWDAGSVRTAVDAVASRLWAATGPPTALGRIYVGAAGRILVLSTAEDLMTAMTGRIGAAALPGAQYAVRYLHAAELPRYERLMKLIDAPGRPAGDASGREPLFFSENIASLGNVLGRLQSVSLDSHDEGGMVRQNVVYRVR